MHKRLIAILLILSLSYQCFVKLGIVIWYQVNKDYIANNLCENRGKPEMNCCGKCYLRKQLKKVETGAGDSTIPEKWNLGEVVFYTVPEGITLTPVIFAEAANYWQFNEGFAPVGIPKRIFHPPSVC